MEAEAIGPTGEAIVRILADDMAQHEDEAAAMDVATKAEAVVAEAAGEDAEEAVAKGPRLPVPAELRSPTATTITRNSWSLAMKAAKLSIEGERNVIPDVA